MATRIIDGVLAAALMLAAVIGTALVPGRAHPR